MMALWQGGMGRQEGLGRQGGVWGCFYEWYRRHGGGAAGRRREAGRTETWPVLHLTTPPPSSAGTSRGARSGTSRRQ